MSIKRTQFSNCSLKEEYHWVGAFKKICDAKGKEIYPRMSSVIFWKLSVIYRRKSPDKISLIQSAALLNAAIVRLGPCDVFLDDLQALCTQVLLLAGAKQLDADLPLIAHEIELQVEKFRSNIEMKIKDLQATDSDVEKNENLKICTMKKIQIEVTERYIDLMQLISIKCIEILGDPPCKYAIAGMGSLARKEITPYSDFEHIILLEDEVLRDDNDYDDVLEYFRWFSVIFHVIVINLKETIIPNVAIQSLNDVTEPNGNWFYDAFTTRGISFDGWMPHACKSPLGRRPTPIKPWTTELIKPVCQMVEYLDADIDLKNGYHLGDILMKTCFVYGEELIYKDFVEQVKITTQTHSELRYSEMLNQLEDDLQNFDAFNNLRIVRDYNTCNIKRVIYRASSLFISALGRMYSLDECSCFDIVEKLNVQDIIDDATAHKLLHAVAIACEIRLKVYMQNKSQTDQMYIDAIESSAEDNILITGQLIELTGEENLIDYFMTTICLQKAIKNANSVQGSKFNLSFNPAIKLVVLYLFGLYDKVVEEWLYEEERLWMRYYVARACSKLKRFDLAQNVYSGVDGKHISNDLLRSAILHDMDQNKSIITTCWDL